MRIGIDIRRADGFGVGTYTKNLVHSLARVGTGHDFVLIGRHEHLQHLGELPANFSFEPYDRRYDAPRSHLTYGLALRRLGLDTLHVPHRWVPLSTPRPYVATLHDLNNILFPTAEGSKLKENLSNSALRLGLKRAAKVIAVSNATKRDAVKRLGLSESNLEVVYDAVDDQVAQPVTDGERQRTLERYSVADPFILYAGRIQVHKNLPRLVDAFAVVKARLEKHTKLHSLKLIIIGDDIGALPEVRHAVLRTRVQDSVRFLGFVPVETLRVFYASAEAFAFPSLYEGFGMPPLEAMANGTPVVTSNVSSLPEAVGDAAELVNPENVFDIARGLQRVLVDDEHRALLRERGARRVKAFSWDKSAKRVLEIYSEVTQR
ncbi:MAG: glycosyltransferase family 1 protein [Acidobacteria bacterium]|nr:glycosyltransferase family 1 protein [Acidobacteriota bacterium]MDA1235029.1 glycosyltransferase family 1 protein [Acidobacteriota bacterium]